MRSQCARSRGVGGTQVNEQGGVSRRKPMSSAGDTDVLHVACEIDLGIAALNDFNRSVALVILHAAELFPTDYISSK
jgi:hypothetical protein